MRILTSCLLCALVGTGTWRSAAAQESRSESQLAEDQALLKRQLSRLRQTMEVLAKRFEDEGRAHAATLLRDGLKQLDTRPEDVGAKTIEELMAAAQENLEGGRSVQSIEAQEAAVRSLERLYSILTDRRGLEDLQKSLDGLQELRKDLGELAESESKLRQETRALRERSATPEQKELRAALERAEAQQRSLLERTQAVARDTNDLDLASLERELDALLAEQRADAGVLGAWKPEEKDALEAATRAAERAASPAARAQRLTQAAAELRAAARSARTPETDLNEAQRSLERASAREERHARAAANSAADAAAQRAAEALAKGAQSVREAAAGRRTREEAASELEAQARALENEAGAEARAAESARDTAEAALARLADPRTSAGTAAEAARKALEAAKSAAKASTAGTPSSGEAKPEPTADDAQRAAQAAAEAQIASQEAARALQRGLEDMERVAPILARSQKSAAERAEKLAESLRALPGEGAQQREKAGAELEAAARSAREAAEAAQSATASSSKSEDAAHAADAASAAEAALERAQAALQSARAARAQSAQSSQAGAQAGAEQALKAEQEALAKETEALQKAAQAAGLSPEAQRAAEEAVKSAAEAMQQAASRMSAGRPSEASGSQSQALEKLQEAARAAESGGTPRTPEDKAEAERQKEEQARIRAELLKLAEKNRQREGAKPSSSMDGASRSAQRAEDALADEDLSQAEQSEADTERQMREAERELGQEEEQYQRLRQEELLFKIAEQVKTLTEEHQAQMRATIEVDSQRKPGDRPTHTSRLRLRKIGQAEQQLGARATDIGKSIRAEQSLVFAELLDQVARDLDSVARDLSEEGDWQSGERVQARQQDVEQALAWLAEALQQEKNRRQQEQQSPPPGQSQPPPQNRLVPDVAELKLLRRVGVDVTEEIERLRILHPEIEEGGEIDPLLLEDIARLGFRHERVSDLFQKFRARLGIPAPSEE